MEAASRFEALIKWAPNPATVRKRPVRSTATLNVIGKDRSGVIARISTFLFRQGGNIEDLEQHVTEGLFTMQMESSWPAGRIPVPKVRQGLARLAKELDMTILFRPHDGKKAVPRLGVLVTQEDHCLEGLVRQVRAGKIKATVALVASNKPTLEAACKALGLPFFYFDDRDKPAHEAAVLAEFDQHQVDFVVLARYMRILSPNFVWHYPNRIVNIHPSLLPSFPGPFAYRQAHRAGVRIMGVTAHFVTMNLDEGPIIAQDSFRLDPRWSLAEIRKRGRPLEAKVLCEGVRLLVEGRLEVGWGKVTVRNR